MPGNRYRPGVRAVRTSLRHHRTCGIRGPPPRCDVSDDALLIITTRSEDELDRPLQLTWSRQVGRKCPEVLIPGLTEPVQLEAIERGDVEAVQRHLRESGG